MKRFLKNFDKMHPKIMFSARFVQEIEFSARIFED